MNALEIRNLTKSYPGFTLDNINLTLPSGCIMGLIGENGAGKSTLMSVLFGLYQPEKGIIKKNGQEVKINNPNDATALNIGMVHQHFKLVSNFTRSKDFNVSILSYDEELYTIGKSSPRSFAKAQR